MDWPDPPGASLAICSQADETGSRELLDWALQRKSRVTATNDFAVSWLDKGRKRGVAKAAS